MSNNMQISSNIQSDSRVASSEERIEIPDFNSLQFLENGNPFGTEINDTEVRTNH